MSSTAPRNPMIIIAGRNTEGNSGTGVPSFLIKMHTCSLSWNYGYMFSFWSYAFVKHHIHIIITRRHVVNYPFRKLIKKCWNKKELNFSQYTSEISVYPESMLVPKKYSTRKSEIDDPEKSGFLIFISPVVLLLPDYYNLSCCCWQNRDAAALLSVDRP